MLPDNAPPEFADRSILWNSVEKIEKAKNSQLAREIEIALPVELSKEQNLSLVRDYVRRNFVNHGMIADIAIHDTGKGNPHAHIMLTMRPIEPSGEWGAKSRKQYVLDRNGEKIKLKSGEYKSVKVSAVDWNDQTKAEEWRKAWADEVNAVLSQYSIAEQIDHRSFERQGIEELPTIHMGVAACQMERKGIPTNRGNHNRNVRITNREIRRLRRQIRDIDKWVKEQSQNDVPSLVEVIDTAMQNRVYRSPEQKMSAFRKAANLVNYIIDKGIEDFDMLQSRVKELRNRHSSVRISLNSTETRLEELKNNIEQRNIYRENQAIFAEYKKIKNPKKRREFYYQHDSEIIMFQRAEEYLQPYFKNGKLPLTKWKAEVEKLTAEKTKLYKEYHQLKADVKEIENVKSGIDEIMREEKQKERQQTRKYEIEL